MGRKPTTASSSTVKCSFLSDCFANHRGNCKCLTNTDFWYKKNHQCPFYKPKQAYQEELERIRERVN